MLKPREKGSDKDNSHDKKTYAEPPAVQMWIIKCTDTGPRGIVRVLDELEPEGYM